MPMRLNRVKGRPLVASTVLAALIAGGVLIAAPATRPSQAEPASPDPKVPVVVQTLAQQKIRAWSSFSGRLHAVDSAEIRPEVGGRITQVLFEDGQMVKAGDVLFVIDPRPFEAAVARAEANLASAQTNAGFA